MPSIWIRLDLARPRGLPIQSRQVVFGHGTTLRRHDSNRASANHGTAPRRLPGTVIYIHIVCHGHPSRPQSHERRSESPSERSNARATWTRTHDSLPRVVLSRLWMTSFHFGK
eukprot:scaffold1484_cov173-Amphora_coffeaeformis.AAC.31